MNNETFYTVADRYNNLITLDKQGLRALADAYRDIADAKSYRIDILRSKLVSGLSAKKILLIAEDVERLGKESKHLISLAANYYVLSMR